MKTFLSYNLKSVFGLIFSISLSPPTGDEKKEVLSDEQQRRVRLTITSSKLNNIQNVCTTLIQKLQKEHIPIRGPVPMPRRRPRITTRRAPCGNGTETYDHFELRIYKRVIDFVGSPTAVVQVVIHAEVSIISE